MATLASLTVRLNINTDPLAAGARRAQQAIRNMGSRMRRDNDDALRGLTRDANGRLRDLRGRFVSEGDRTGRSFGRRLVSGIGRSIGGAGRLFVRGITGALGFASRSISSNPVIGVIALAIASAIAHTLAPFLAAALSGLVVSATGIGVIGLGAVILKDEPAVKKAAGKLKSTVKDVLRTAAAPLVPAFTKALGDIRKKFKSLDNEFAGMFGAMSLNVPTLTDGFTDALESIIQGIEDMLTGSQETFKGFSNMIRKIGEGLGAFFRILGDNPKDTKLALEDLGSFIKWLLVETAKFIRFLTSTYSTVRAWVIRVIGFFKWLYDVLVGHSIVPDLINKIIAWFAKLPGRIVGLVSRVVARVVAGFVSMYTRVTSWVSKTVSRAVAWFARLPGRAASAVASLAGRLYARVYSAGSRMVSAARSGVSRAVSAVRQLPGRAASAVSGVGSRLYSAGRSLVNGFVRGIQSAFRSVRSTLNRLTNMLPDWKGPASLDARILTPAGQSVIAGFMRGIDAQAPALRKQLGGITSDIPGIAASVSGVIRAGHAQPQRVVLDVRGGDDELKRMIKKWVRVDGRGEVQRAFT